MERPESIKGSRKPTPAKAVKLLDDEEVERMVAEAEEKEEAEEEKPE
jgi:hypothetical protein